MLYRQAKYPIAKEANLKSRISFAFMLIVLLSSCAATNSSVETASAEFKQYKSYDNLQILHERLFIGMHQSEVIRLLGEPDYSPIEGQYYYSTDRYEYYEEQDREVPVGLVVDYRDEKGIVTENLHEFWLGKIGE